MSAKLASQAWGTALGQIDPPLRLGHDPIAKTYCGVMIPPSA
jgi:hypothetical protein